MLYSILRLLASMSYDIPIFVEKLVEVLFIAKLLLKCIFVFTEKLLFAKCFVEHVGPVEDLSIRFRHNAFVYAFPGFYEGIWILYLSEHGASAGVVALRVPHAPDFAEDVLYVMVPVHSGT